MDYQNTQEASGYVTKEQGTLMEQLQHSVRQTRDHAIHIGNALEEHNTILDTLHDEVVQVDHEGENQNRNLANLLQEGSNHHFYTIVLVLLLIIFIVMLI